MFYYTDFVVAAVVVPDFNVIAGNSKHFLWPNNLLLSLFRLLLLILFLLLLLLATLNVCLIISRMPFIVWTKLNSNSNLILMYTQIDNILYSMLSLEKTTVQNIKSIVVNICSSHGVSLDSPQLFLCLVFEEIHFVSTFPSWLKLTLYNFPPRKCVDKLRSKC